MARANATQARAQLAYGPGHSPFSITPHATNHLQQNSEDVTVRAIYVGGAGDVTGTVFTESGTATEQTFTGVAAGTVLNVAFTHINTTSTATLMIGLL